jgi:hypothetical protein
MEAGTSETRIAIRNKHGSRNERNEDRDPEQGMEAGTSETMMTIRYRA